MSKETSTTKVKKSLPIKEACFMLVGVIIGIVISYGLFASAIKEAANDIEVSTTAEEEQSNEDTTVDSDNEDATNENETSVDETEETTDESTETETTSENTADESGTTTE